jgi:hypothetical protein
MPRRVDQVELVLVAVRRPIVHAHGVELDGDASLPLELVVVQHLLAHLPLVESRGPLQEPVRQRRLPVVDMCDDAEVANVVEAHVRGILGSDGFQRRTPAGC